MTTQTMVKPRIRLVPAALESRGEEMAALGERLGYTLDGWQLLCLHDIALVEDGKFASYEAAVLASRQNGKTLLGELYALYRALRAEAVLFSAHRADTVRVVFHRLWAALPDELGAERLLTNGREQISFPAGGFIDFRTRTPRSARGHTYDAIVVDEAQIYDEAMVSASLPTLRTRPDPQIVYLGCAPDAAKNEYAEVLHSLRQRALSGAAGLCYLEWSPDIRDAEGNELRADELGEEQLDDRDHWEAATPALESGRIDFEQIAREREAMDSVSFSCEILSVGNWPLDGGAFAGPVSLAAWESLVDLPSAIPPGGEEIPEVVLGLDTSPERRVSIALAGYREDGLLHVDLVGRYEGLPAAVEAIEKIERRDDVSVKAVYFDAEPANVDLSARLRRDYALTESQLRREHASKAGVTACGALVDLVNLRRFRHRGQRELADAFKGALVRPIGDGWVYDRRRSRSDVSPLLAAAVALWGADAELQPAAEINISIY
jgi:hypothetical protein